MHTTLLAEKILVFFILKMKQTKGRCDRKDIDGLLDLMELMSKPDHLTVRLSPEVLEAVTGQGIATFKGLSEPGRALSEDGAQVSGHCFDEAGNLTAFRWSLDKLPEVARGYAAAVGSQRGIELTKQPRQESRHKLRAEAAKIRSSSGDGRVKSSRGIAEALIKSSREIAEALIDSDEAEHNEYFPKFDPDEHDDEAIEKAEQNYVKALARRIRRAEGEGPKKR